MVLWTMRANKSAEKDTVEWERDQKRLRELECSVSEEAAAREVQGATHEAAIKVHNECCTVRLTVVARRRVRCTRQRSPSLKRNKKIR